MKADDEKLAKIGQLIEECMSKLTAAKRLLQAATEIKDAEEPLTDNGEYEESEFGQEIERFG
ncbi:MAG: hypothetical protein JW759_09950 [Candidatus Coatesbacteria bacterium]|nr:hypothetical protein [Candidatus Coatesbacteria bacterium]